jgi:hypothetical protein
MTTALKDDNSLKTVPNWESMVQPKNPPKDPNAPPPDPNTAMHSGDVKDAPQGELVGGVLYVNHKEVGRLEDGVMYMTHPENMPGAPGVQEADPTQDQGSQIDRIDGTVGGLMAANEVKAAEAKAQAADAAAKDADAKAQAADAAAKAAQDKADAAAKAQADQAKPADPNASNQAMDQPHYGHDPEPESKSKDKHNR